MTILSCMLIGAAIGAGIGLAAWVFSFSFSFLTCGLFGDAGNLINFVTYCLVPGSMIGLVYGIVKQIRQSGDKRRQDAAAAKQQRIKWANEIKQFSAEIFSKCSKNNDYHDIVSFDGQSMNRHELILEELSETGTLMGKLDTISKKIEG